MQLALQRTYCAVLNTCLHGFLLPSVAFERGAWGASVDGAIIELTSSILDTLLCRQLYASRTKHRLGRRGIPVTSQKSEVDVQTQARSPSPDFIPIIHVFRCSTILGYFIVPHSMSVTNVTVEGSRACQWATCNTAQWWLRYNTNTVISIYPSMLTTTIHPPAITTSPSQVASRGD